VSRSGLWDFGRSKSGWRSVAHAGEASGVERLALWMRRHRRWISIALWSSVVAAFASVEIRTSWLQSRLLTELDRQLIYHMEPGAGPALHAPGGPYNERLGYSNLQDYLPRLSARGFEVVAHARVSRLVSGLTALGLPFVYHEKTQTGLSILDRHDEPLFTARYPKRVYQRFEEIPPLVLHTLLFIENRELLESASASRNPAIEWDRLAGAAFDLGRHAVDPRHQVSGGSTLVTQLEKLRHSPGGRTASVTEKGRQLIAASLAAYLDGTNTTAVRRRVVRDYLNSLPLGAVAGYGEVTGLADGLWAWFGADFDAVNRLLGNAATSRADASGIEAQARSYREVLTLLLAIKKPSVYLPAGVPSLDARVNGYLRTLADAGVVSPALRDDALRVRVPPRHQVQPQAVPFVDRKAADAVRLILLSQLGLPSTYDLDRLDLAVHTTLDGAVQNRVTAELRQFTEPSYIATAGGLIGPHLLGRGSPAGVVYSFVLYERGPSANLLRVEADTFNGPLQINRGTRLELGSTAKLRTLVTYLEVMTALHARYAGMTRDALRSASSDPKDGLSRWAVDYLVGATDRSLPSMLDAAMTRRYAASPSEAFFTGGGVHHFANYEREDNGRVLTVREAFRRSVNLVFIRLMRDLVHYFAFGPDGVNSSVLRDAANPLRRQYLNRFADEEGQTFLRRFFVNLESKAPDQALAVVLRAHHPTPRRLAVIYRSVWPEAHPEQFAAFMRAHGTDRRLSAKQMDDLYQTADPSRLNLNDRGYLAHVHPLELWLLTYLRHDPKSTWSDVRAASTTERQEVYRWLFTTRSKQGQNVRIQTLLEEDAFRQIHRGWQRLGYPFSSLVPSYATAIGSSGDNPAALAELAGIILNDGIRCPSVRVEQLRFGEATPFETVLEHRPSNGVRALPREVVAILQQELWGVVREGTGRRLAHGLALGDGRMLPVGGKTGTGDNRFEIGGPAGRRPLVLNRTATFVFVLGSRFFGALTAYVSGQAATSYTFTSALTVELLRRLGPALRPLLQEEAAADSVRNRRSAPITALPPSEASR
jgi:membrane peptidoglycan carboxypeptidase